MYYYITMSFNIISSRSFFSLCLSFPTNSFSKCTSCFLSLSMYLACNLIWSEFSRYLFLSLSQILILWLVFPLWCGGGWREVEVIALACGRAQSGAEAAVLILVGHRRKWDAQNSTAVQPDTAVATTGSLRDLSEVRHSHFLLSISQSVFLLVYLIFLTLLPEPSIGHNPIHNSLAHRSVVTIVK